ncbi:DVUA0089 family protein [Pseudoduganella plicata]|uniref:PEP-CTERM sorting domain-containing protein n=1 Tax=Pseudoduganella plicata TaxID=321984 RepID=A0A4P7BJ19_9BURK|nr:DVUA0089 family protein [Pseudoduganella plicata]QBQ38881.1 PEP-CTERM sorting domain-containing protein [Pseudoduganella plicata]GGZ09523.1 hypothetical protein GCM10007388_48810 [Pseudoduganella plicata]
MKHLCKSAIAILCASAACLAHADSFEAQIAYHNDVVYHTITLMQSANLLAWTDSYQDGTNFDPIVAIWRDDVRLAENDDAPWVGPGQTKYDSGFGLFGLEAGTYVFTITAFDNFSNGGLLSAGFAFDSQDPIPLSEWCEPSNHCGMGPAVRLNWTVTPVPEPTTYSMLAAGLVLAGVAARRRRG